MGLPCKDRLGRDSGLFTDEGGDAPPVLSETTNLDAKGDRTIRFGGY